uniref:Uncharacterized protein n=1 Tax=Anguilla anguilla TaxID=7936 RepID=A0A0E9UXR9_ANGAN
MTCSLGPCSSISAEPVRQPGLNNARRPPSPLSAAAQADSK